MVVIKLINNSNPNYNDLIKWTIIVSNNGPNMATGVIVNDLLPKSVELTLTKFRIFPILLTLQ